MATKTNKKNSDSKEFSARLMAVQAYYQTTQNAKPIRTLVQEYLDRGLEVDGEAGVEGVVQPHGGLFKRILLNLDERLAEVNEIVEAQISKKEPVPVEVNEEGEELPLPDKDIEPLLKAVLFCGASELLTNLETDAPLIINDYLNVTHAFYEQHQVSFANGILDSISKLLRE